ncbi:MAG: lipid-A-disaccharide synthase, partial [Planctomycetes bacterium]|nr:lipid-A-disaccharide synthase [Planctomycetota bacterium]
YMMAGESSCDLHAAVLLRPVHRRDPTIRFRGLGGERMLEAGVDIRENLVERSVMGLRRVLLEMGHLIDLAARFVEEIDRDPPDAVLLVDYPGLNLNLARMAKSRGIPVIYFICPQVWAWAPWRIRRIARRTDLLLVILPFEEPLYRPYRPETFYVGNPVFDHLQEFEHRARSGALPAERRILALFPGSRRQEVEESLPALLDTARALVEEHDLEVVVSCQRERLRSVVEAAVEQILPRAHVFTGSSAELQSASFLSLVVSGTATLEQLFFAVPMVVVYPVRAWERWAFRYLSVTPFVALANLFAGEALFPEVLFAAGEEGRILEAARPLVAGPQRDALVQRLREVKAERLHPGATERAAERVLQFLDARRSPR